MYFSYLFNFSGFFSILNQTIIHTHLNSHLWACTLSVSQTNLHGFWNRGGNRSSPEKTLTALTPELCYCAVKVLAAAQRSTPKCFHSITSTVEQQFQDLTILEKNFWALLKYFLWVFTSTKPLFPSLMWIKWCPKASLGLILFSGFNCRIHLRRLRNACVSSQSLPSFSVWPVVAMPSRLLNLS